jgi:AraC family transcriptional regulator
MRTATREDNLAAIQRVLLAVHDDLSSPWTIRTLAKVAGFSPYHFQRMFAALTGETVGDHVRRLRMERAAVQIRRGIGPITALALEAGYGSPEAFTRQFTANYGIAPTSYRSEGHGNWNLPTPNALHFGDRDSVVAFQGLGKPDTSIEWQVEAVAPIRLVGIEHRGPFQFLPKTWERLFKLMQEAGLSPDQQVFGTYADDLSDDLMAADIRGFTGFVSTGELPAGLESREVGGGEFLKATYRGSGHLLSDFWFRLYREVVPVCGRELREGLNFELYPNGLLVPAERFEATLHIPVN